MALSILDGNQSATTLSTILSSGQHITAHTVVSLGTQAIADIVNATSAGLTNTQLRASAVTIAGTVTVNSSANFDVRVTQGGDPVDGNNAFPVYGTVTANLPTGVFNGDIASDTGGGEPLSGVQLGYFDQVTDGFVFVNGGHPLPISGTVTANGGDFASTPLGAYPSKALRIGYADDEEYNAVGLASGGKPLPVVLYNTAQDAIGSSIGGSIPLVISGTVTIGSALPAGTNRIGVVTIGGGTVTIGAGTAQIGSVTASISGTVPISISSVTVGNSVIIGSLPAISGTVTANTFALQGTAVTTSNFTSTTASTVLASFNATREVLTIFNEGAGNLHICAGATCTTIAYQVRLSAGDYYEVPNHQTSITHSAVFATAGTARVTEVS